MKMMPKFRKIIFSETIAKIHTGSKSFERSHGYIQIHYLG